MHFLKALKNGCGAVLTSVEVNLVDMVWSNSRPPLPSSDLHILAQEYCGKFVCTRLCIVLGTELDYITNRSALAGEGGRCSQDYEGEGSVGFSCDSIGRSGMYVGAEIR